MRSRLRQRAVKPLWLTSSQTVTTLVIAPHPDDEALGCGGLIARRIREGGDVHIVFLTDGAASHPGFPPAKLATLRAEEAKQSARALGLNENSLSFFGAPDGQLHQLGKEFRDALIEQLSTRIALVAPTEILITTLHDGSSEHRAANHLLRSALHRLSSSDIRVLEYPVWSLWNPRLLRENLHTATAVYHLQLSSAENAAKQTAIRTHKSQVEPLVAGEKALLSQEFLSYFSSAEEFYFECSPSFPESSPLRD